MSGGESYVELPDFGPRCEHRCRAGRHKCRADWRTWQCGVVSLDTTSRSNVMMTRMLLLLWASWCPPHSYPPQVCGLTIFTSIHHNTIRHVGHLMDAQSETHMHTYSTIFLPSILAPSCNSSSIIEMSPCLALMCRAVPDDYPTTPTTEA